jgi:hypothetical protein
MRHALFCSLAIVSVAIASSRGSAQARPAVVIGGEQNLGAELGIIRDVAVLPRLLVILDRSTPHLKVFDHSGRLRQTLGRSGSGPGEFRAPFALTYDSAAHSVYVVDPANARVSQYLASDTLQLARTLATDVVNLVDLCVLRRRLFGLARGGAQLIYEFSIVDGRLVTRRSFGAARTSHPLGRHPHLRTYAADGRVLCDNAAGIIYLASRLLGELHVLNPETQTQQTIGIHDFRPIRFEAREGGALTLGMPEAGFYEGLLGLAPTTNGVSVIVGRY